MNFEQWLADVLGQETKEKEVANLLKDETALHFLIAWSLFESKCFGGNVKSYRIEEFTTRMISESFKCDTISQAAGHFHARYQDKKRFNTLMQKDKALVKRMNTALETCFTKLKPEDIAFLVAVVVYRFRNNIFHGNKGVPSWPKYSEQIALCTGAMQSFVSHAIRTSPKPIAA